VTDKLKSYGVAKSQLLPNVEHRQSRYLTDIFDKFFFSFGAIVIGHGRPRGEERV